MPDVDASTADDSDTGPATETQWLMINRGMTEHDANTFMAVQHRLSNWADRVRHDPGYVAFANASSLDDGGLLIVEPDAAGEALRSMAPVGMEVRVATRTRVERESDLSAVEVAARAALGEVGHGVSYQSFNDSYTVFLFFANASTHMRRSLASDGRHFLTVDLEISLAALAAGPSLRTDRLHRSVRPVGQSVAVDPDAASLRTSVLRDLQREPMAVYEVLYAANGSFADRPVSERLAIAERVFNGLVNEGAVRLWRGWSIEPEHPREPVLEDEMGQILRSWSIWAPEHGIPVVYMELVPGA